jgi:hypothetical protein
MFRRAEIAERVGRHQDRKAFCARLTPSSRQ